MKPRVYKDDGIVLGRISFGEADRILNLFTRSNGKLSVLAKGVRKLTSRKRGHIENFSHIRFSASGSHGLPIMAETETIDNFLRLRHSLKKTSVAYFFLETVSRLTREDESHEDVFNLLLDSLKKLEDSESLRSLRHEFTKKILAILGFWPWSKKMDNPDKILEQVTERQLSTIRIGKKLQL